MPAAALQSASKVLPIRRYHGHATKREAYDERLKQLRAERQTWESTWRDIAEQMVPYRVNFEPRTRNRGDKKESKIINSTPVRALSTLAAGMMAGITSPARTWFSLTIEDQKLAMNKAVKVYLNECQSRIEAALQTSNWYTTLSNATYLDLGSFGTSAMFAEESHDNPGHLNFRPMHVGEYWLDVNHEGVVDTCFRELFLTTRQIVQRFGLGKCSQQLREAYDRGAMGQGWLVYHAIQPNDDYAQGKYGRDGMLFSSCWWDPSEVRRDFFLSESGYQEFPVLAPRWTVRGSDVYGRGPGWEVRGDCRMLQHHETRLLQMVDMITKPPMKASENIPRASLLPNSVTHIPVGADNVFEAAVMVPPLALQVMEAHIVRVQDRINEALYVDLWRRLIDDERAQRATATEIEALRQEIMLMLGPLLENLDNGLLEPAIERTFAVLERANMLPLPPPEIQGQQVKVKFVSIMHQMQQATGLSGIRTLVSETVALSQVQPDVLDKLDGDFIVDELQRITGVPPEAVRSKDEVTQSRQARAENEQAKQTGEAALAATQGVKNLSSADPQKLSELVGSLSPVAAAQGGALGPLTQ